MSLGKIFRSAENMSDSNFESTRGYNELIQRIEKLEEMLIIKCSRYIDNTHGYKDYDTYFTHISNTSCRSDSSKGYLTSEITIKDAITKILNHLGIELRINDEAFKREEPKDKIELTAVTKDE